MAIDSSEEEYSQEYCSMLEAVYGPNMMSEGREEGIEFMFDRIPLCGKRALDIGCGLGGVSFYLAENYSMQVTGVDVSAWVIEEAKRRTAADLKDKLDFQLIKGSDWPFPSEQFDLIYSKGVFTHLENKEELFWECHRLLKAEGLFVITDWLSDQSGRWGDHMEKLIQLEKLSIFPASEGRYGKCLSRAGFELLSARDDTAIYTDYNRAIADSLSSLESRALFIEKFGEAALEASLLGYESIIRAMESGELRVLRFVAKKAQGCDEKF